MLIIGDVHGKRDAYLDIISQEFDSTLQLGDFDFDYSWMKEGENFFFKGNHDNYDQFSPYDLGDFGVFRNVYFVRGAYSIDKFMRTIGVDYWENEELSHTQMSEAIQDYAKITPNIVVTHDCPYSFAAKILGYNDKTITRMGLQAMLDIHKPSLWIFGHHHHSMDVVIDGIRFVCLSELETFRV